MKIIKILAVLISIFCFSALSDAQAQTKILHGNELISMDFKNAELADVLKIFSQQSGLNFIASQEVAGMSITLFLDQVSVQEALERILQANNLTYETQVGSDIFVVKPVERPTRNLKTRIYPLKYATVPSSKLNKTISIEQEDEESSSTSQGGAAGALTQNSTGIVAAIRAVLSEFGSVIEDPRTNSIIVTDIPVQFPIIEQTIARLDVEVPQVLIEVEMLDISKSTADKVGAKFGDTPFSMTGAQRDHLYPWNQNRLLDKGFEFEDPEYRVGTIDASGFSVILQFLQTQTDTKNLARPRLLTMNNETAQIKIATDEAIGIQTQTGSSEGVSTQSVEAERVQTGVFLTVTPQINLQLSEIVMAIAPKVIQARTGGTFQGETFKDPEERGSQSILKIKDGDTIMLGGLLRTDYSNVVTKIPILGDIPLLGKLFSHKNKSEDQRELIIFITPHIVKKELSPVNLGPVVDENLTREQNIPSGKLHAINAALSEIEDKK